MKFKQKNNTSYMTVLPPMRPSPPPRSTRCQ